jgi:hypothetical protein
MKIQGLFVSTNLYLKKMNEIFKQIDDGEIEEV